jgi:hypothetical protein
MNDIEHQNQVALFDWIDMNIGRMPELKLAFAIPNGTRTTPQIAKRMVAEGVRKGVPDVLLPIARGEFHGLWIEMKSPGNYPKPDQREWLKALALEGHYTACCHDWQEAAEIIQNYLEGKLS